MKHLAATILTFSSFIPCTLAWLTQSDGYNIGVTLGSAFACLIFLVVMGFIFYYCCLREMLRNYRRDQQTYDEKRGVGSGGGGGGGGGMGSMFKKKPQNTSNKSYYRDREPEYVPPTKVSNESLQHSGGTGYYSGTEGYHGPQQDEYRNGTGGGSPMDYGPGTDQYGRRPGDKGYDKSAPSDRGYGGGDRDRDRSSGGGGYAPRDMDSSTESRTSVRVAGADRPGSRGVVPYDDRDREPSGGRRSHETSAPGYAPYSGGTGSSGRGILSRSPATNRAIELGSASAGPLTHISGSSGPKGIIQTTETTYVTPVTERVEQQRTAQGGKITYQTTRTYQQRTVQQSATAAAYMGSSV